MSGNDDLDNLELNLQINTEGEEKLDSAAKSTEEVGKAAERAARKIDLQTAAINRRIIALERQSQLAGTKGVERIDTKETFSIADLASTTDKLDRIEAAYDRFRQVEIASQRAAAEKSIQIEQERLGKLDQLAIQRIKAIERRVATPLERVGLDHQTTLEKYGTTNQNVDRIDAVYEKIYSAEVLRAQEAAEAVIRIERQKIQRLERMENERIRSVEKSAATPLERIDISRQSSLEKYGTTPENVDRIDAAYDKLYASEVRKAQDAADKIAHIEEEKVRKQEATIKSRIDALTRKAADPLERNEIDRVSAIEKYGTNQENIDKINAAYDKFYAELVAKAERARQRVAGAGNSSAQDEISALEARANKVGKSKATLLGEERDAHIGRLAGDDKTPQNINRIHDAYSKLIAEEEKFKISQRELGTLIGYNNSYMLQFGQSILQVASSLPLATVLIGGTVAGFAALGIGAVLLANSLAKASIEIINFSERTGLSIEGSQVFLKSAELAGVNGEALATSMKKLSEGMADGGLESKKTAAALREIGVQAYNVNNGVLRPLDDILPEIFDGLKKVNNEADRNTLALTILGRSGKELLPLIENYDKYSDAVRSTGVVISDQGIKKANEYRESVALLGEKWDGLVNKLKVGAVGLISFVFDIKGIKDRKGKGTDYADTFGSPLLDATEGADANAKVINTKNKALADAGNATIEALKKQERGNDPDKQSQYRIDELDKEIKTRIDKLKPDVAPKVNADDEAKISALIKERDAIAENVKTRNQYSQTLREVTELEKRSAYEGMNGEQRVNAQRQESLLTLGKNAGLIERINAAYNKMAATEKDKVESRYNETIERDNAMARRQNIERQGRNAYSSAINGSEYENDDDAVDKGYQARRSSSLQLFELDVKAAQEELKSAKTLDDKLKVWEKINRAALEYNKTIDEAKDEADLAKLKNKAAYDESAYDADQKIKGIGLSDQEDDVRRQYSLGALGLQTGKGRGVESRDLGSGTVASIMAQYSLREQEEQKLNAIAQARVDEIDDADQRRVAQAQLESDIRKSQQDDELEAVKKILDLRRQEIEDSKEEARSLYSDLKSGHPENFFKGQADKLTQGLFVNATAPIIQSLNSSIGGLFGGQTDSDGKKTAFGKLVQGTILEDKGDAKNVQLTATNVNSTAIKQLTVAVKAQTDALLGSGSSATSGTVGPKSADMSGPMPSNLDYDLLNATSGKLLGSGASNINPQVSSTIDPDMYDGTGTAPSSRSIGSIGSTSSAPTSSTSNSSSLTGLLGSLGGAAMLGASVATAVESMIGPNINSNPVYSAWSGSVTNPNHPSMPGGSVEREQYVAAHGGPVSGTYGYNANGAIGTGGFGIQTGGAAFPTPQTANYSRANMFGEIAGAGAASLAALPSILKFFGSSPAFSSSSLGGFGTDVKNLSAGASNLVGVGDGHGVDGLYHAFTGGDYGVSQGDGKEATASSLGLTSTAGRIGTIAGAAGIVAGGALGILNGIKQGGVGGTLSAVGAGAGAAAALDPEPISKAVLTVLATGATLIKALIGDPKQARDTAENNALQGEKYQAPPTVNQVEGADGNNLNFGKNGLARDTPYQGFSIEQPYKIQDPTNPLSYINVPGQVIQPWQTAQIGANSQYITPPPTSGNLGSQLTMTVYALDSKSIMDRSSDIGQAVYNELQKGGPLSNQIQQTILSS